MAFYLVFKYRCLQTSAGIGYRKDYSPNDRFNS
jgi:hypothetical protein